MLQFRWLLLVILGALLAGCPSLGPQTAPPSVDRAEAAARRGDQVAAARVYEELADENAGSDRNEFLLRAARAYLAARRGDEAARVLGSLGPQLTDAQMLERRLLGVELALVNGQAQQAWQQLSGIAEPTAPPATALRYLALRQRAAFASGRPVDAVRASLARERFLPRPEDRRANRAELLGDLRDASERGLRIEPRATNDPVIRGWLELAPLAAAAARSPATATADIEAWRARNPAHPANDVVMSELLGIPTGSVETVAHAALLLPLSGRQASAAATVRDGFLTAYFMDRTSGKPLVRVYDTGETSAAEAITAASQAGAQLIVGPLTRDEVMAAADFAIRRPPILALNFLPPDRSVPPRFYQFALSPEDEAREVAQRILADGHRRGIVIAPDGDWGTRVANAFTAELEAGGGAVLGRTSFDPSETDYSAAITQALRLTDSRVRHQRLESVVGGKLQFEPRRRGDVGFIFAPAQTSAARLLRPQLRFHFAGDIPTYATSESYEPDPAANRDMEGLYLPDMPWVLGGRLADNVRAALREAWPTGGPRRNRLFAFGFDAYRLMSALRAHSDGAAGIIQGLTGRLAFGPDGRVRRDLDWAQMRDGQAQPLSPTGD